MPSLSPDKSDFYFDEGIECQERDDVSGAIFNWSLNIEMDKDNADAYYSRATALNDLFLWRLAMIDYDKAIEINPFFIDALINRGILKDEHNDPQGAIMDFEQALTINDIEEQDAMEINATIGNIYLNMENKEKAHSYLVKAAKLGSDWAQDILNQDFQ